MRKCDARLEIRWASEMSAADNAKQIDKCFTRSERALSNTFASNILTSSKRQLSGSVEKPEPTVIKYEWMNDIENVYWKQHRRSDLYKKNGRNLFFLSPKCVHCEWWSFWGSLECVFHFWWPEATALVAFCANNYTASLEWRCDFIFASIRMLIESSISKAFLSVHSVGPQWNSQ